MSQRGISLELVEFARQFGEPNLDKIVLDPKGLRQMIDVCRDFERKAKKALDKGGLVVVEAGGTLITTYRLDSFDRRKAYRRKRSRH